MATTGLKKTFPKEGAKKDIAASYNEWKEFEGKQYTGMKIGRRHKWYYDKGEWKEQKITPDKWEFEFDVIKRRAGHAPPGSGVPIGTEYHWYILADQTATKLKANDYTTSMKGFKFKIAHKRADKEKWSASDRAQRKLLIKILKEHIATLEKEPVSSTGGPFEEKKVTPKKSGKPVRQKKELVEAE